MSTYGQQKIQEAILLLHEISEWQDERFQIGNETTRIKDRLIDALAIIQALLEEMK